MAARTQKRVALAAQKIRANDVAHRSFPRTDGWPLASSPTGPLWPGLVPTRLPESGHLKSASTASCGTSNPGRETPSAPCGSAQTPTEYQHQTDNMHTTPQPPPVSSTRTRNHHARTRSAQDPNTQHNPKGESHRLLSFR